MLFQIQSLKYYNHLNFTDSKLIIQRSKRPVIFQSHALHRMIHKLALHNLTSAPYSRDHAYSEMLYTHHRSSCQRLRTQHYLYVKRIHNQVLTVFVNEFMTTVQNKHSCSQYTSWWGCENISRQSLLSLMDCLLWSTKCWPPTPLDHYTLLPCLCECYCTSRKCTHELNCSITFSNATTHIKDNLSNWCKQCAQFIETNLST